MVFSKNKRAEAGIGTLILFIAFVIVAAIAAAVLIQTSSALQSKALATGSKAQAEVSNGITIISIMGENASLVASIDVFTIKVKPMAGSDALKLNGTYIDFTSGDVSAAFEFNDTADCSPASLGALGTTYGVNPRVGYAVPGVLAPSDVVDLCINVSTRIGEAEPVLIAVSPRSGQFVQAAFETPDIMTSSRMQLFP
ncbi:MAG TPA: archaellin/type IV pilin N-terminal domain-containing protein [Acidobacteriota bacterium]|nr:archaellin/type IV pilin N-terminal domain-containing protein [Acidobacteriota bacterium]